MAEDKKILIIDDEEDFCSFVKMNLEAIGGFEVSTCSDSRIAVRQVRLQRPDLILLDIMMPGRDGSGIAAELKADKATQDIPIIFLTALVSEEDIERSDGFIEGRFFLAKPVKTEKLADAISTMIRS